MQEKIIKPIGYIKTDFKEKFGIPRQSGRSPNSVAVIEFLPEFSSEIAFREIEKFSHLWILFDFTLARKENPSLSVRPPRLGGNKRVGVFASRSPFRPNNIGLSCVKLQAVNKTEKGITLTVLGADILDGTPIYDIKPYIPSTDRIENAIGGYAEQFTDYKLEVDFPKDLLDKIKKEKQKALVECLEDDPRPSYQNDDREYGMKFDIYNIKFKVKNSKLTVIEVK